MKGYQKALEIYAERPIRDDELDHGTIEALARQSDSGNFFLGQPAPEDQEAFLFAVLALKTLACATSDHDRTASSRLLRASASAIDRYELAPTVAGHFMVQHTGDEILIVLIRYFQGRSKSSLVGTVTLDI